MQTSHFGKSLNYHLTLYSLTQTALAKRAGLDQSAISQLISRAKRPEVETLRAMCMCWPDASANLRVLIEHLRDEMVRAGHDPLAELEFRPLNPNADHLNVALAKLATLVHLDSDVAALTMDLVALASRAYYDAELQAADPAGNGYGPDDPPASLAPPARPRASRKPRA